MFFQHKYTLLFAAVITPHLLYKKQAHLKLIFCTAKTVTLSQLLVKCEIQFALWLCHKVVESPHGGGIPSSWWNPLMMVESLHDGRIRSIPHLTWHRRYLSQ